MQFFIRESRYDKEKKQVWFYQLPYYRVDKKYEWEEFKNLSEIWQQQGIEALEEEMANQVEQNVLWFENDHSVWRYWWLFLDWYKENDPKVAKMLDPLYTFLPFDIFRKAMEIKGFDQTEEYKNASRIRTSRRKTQTKLLKKLWKQFISEGDIKDCLVWR